MAGKTYTGKRTYITVGTMPADNVELLAIARRVCRERLSSSKEALNEGALKAILVPYIKEFVREEGYPPHLQSVAENGLLDDLLEIVQVFYYNRQA